MTSRIDTSPRMHTIRSFSRALGSASVVLGIGVSTLAGAEGRPPVEPRGLLAEWDAARGRLTVSGAAKVLFFNRRTLAKQMGLPESTIELVENDVGGGFGARGEFYPEDFLIPFAARHTGSFRPGSALDHACIDSANAAPANFLSLSACAALASRSRAAASDASGLLSGHGVVRRAAPRDAQRLVARLRFRRDRRG